jgi:hypothetical protein
MRRQDVTAEMIGKVCTFFDDDEICGGDPAGWFVQGCAHEHVTQVIAFCAVHVPKASDGSWTCGQCQRGPEPHECPVAATQVPRPVPAAGGARCPS